MAFSRDQTQMAKGLAITFMYIHHLFTFPRRMVDGDYYVSLFPSIRLEYDLGYVSVICVGMFLFLSGYGLYMSKGKKNLGTVKFIVRRLRSFYQVYWFYFMIFVPIGLIFFDDVTFFRSDTLRYEFNIIILIKNFIGISSSYNGEYWFVWLYVAFIIIFPLVLFSIERNAVLFFIFCVLLYFSPLAVAAYSGPDLGTIAYWQLVFITGIYCAKFNLFERIEPKYINALNSSMIVLICLLLKLRRVPDFILVPPLVLCSCSIFNKFKYIKYIMKFLGDYSFPMWLMHSFFCYYYFQWLVYWPRISVLVLLNLMAITIIVAVCGEFVRTRLVSYFSEKRFM